MIDMSLMKGIRVDPRRQTVRAQTGIKLGEFDRETQAFGLATTQGVVPTVGMAGLTLGGGWGHLHAKYGLAIDNVVAAEFNFCGHRYLLSLMREPLQSNNWNGATMMYRDHQHVHQVYDRKGRKVRSHIVKFEW